MNCFKNQSELEERARACGQLSSCTDGFCKGAAISVPVQSMQNSCLLLPPAVIPGGGIHAQSITGATAFVLLGGTQLVTVAGGGFVPEH